MKSMTGYGLGKAQSENSIIEVSLRAVNGRYFEPRFHIPKEFIPFEIEVKKLLQENFSRGTIDIFISRRVKPGVSIQNVSLNLSLTKKYLHAYKTLAKTLKIKPQVHLDSFARLPEVMSLDDTFEVGGDEKKSLLQAIKKAIEDCTKERQREGKSLRHDLESLLECLEKEVSSIEAVREEANQNLLSRFEQKIKARLQGSDIDPARLSQEIVIQVERSDINEEVTRLREHIKNYKNLFSASEPIGKKLDFYTQELLREVNTIGSKSSLSKLTEKVVESKTLIERLREQVQNVE
jgi:uncharacterized protein (TIGR00255 family)